MLLPSGSSLQLLKLVTSLAEAQPLLIGSSPPESCSASLAKAKGSTTFKRQARAVLCGLTNSTSRNDKASGRGSSNRCQAMPDLSTR